jgi:cell division ATPase FtsA
MFSLPFLSKSKEVQNKFLTVHISSNDVKCVCFYYDAGNLKIIGSGRQALETGSVRAGNLIDIENVADALEIAATQATDELEDDVNDVIFGVSGDLCIGLTTTVRLKKPKPAKIKKKEIEDLTEKINETSYIQVLNEYVQNTANSDVDLEIITSSNVYTKLDGNEITDIKGNKGSVLEMAVFNAYTPNYHIENLKELAKKTGLNILAIGSELYTLTEELTRSDPQLKDFILINMGYDSTNVAVVFGGGIVSTKSMVVGYKHFADHLSEKMGLTQPESDKLLKAYIGGSLTQSESSIISAAVEDILELWLEGLRILFGEFTGVKTFASNILLTGTGTDIPELIQVVSNEPWVKSIPFKSPPTYKKISFMDLKDISDSTGRTTGTEWLDPACQGVIYLEMQEEGQ